MQIDDETWQSEVVQDDRVAPWAISGAAMEALTLYEVLERYHPPEMAADREWIYLKLWPKTGRRHQIRVHLASLGRPLVGDLTYGRATPLVDRLCLHCRQIQLLDLQGQRFHVEAPMPKELVQIMQGLEKVGTLGKRAGVMSNSINIGFLDDSFRYT